MYMHAVELVGWYRGFHCDFDCYRRSRRLCINLGTGVAELMRIILL